MSARPTHLRLVGASPEPLDSGAIIRTMARQRLRRQIEREITRLGEELEQPELTDSRRRHILRERSFALGQLAQLRGAR